MDWDWIGMGWGDSLDYFFFFSFFFSLPSCFFLFPSLFLYIFHFVYYIASSCLDLEQDMDFGHEFGLDMTMKEYDLLALYPQLVDVYPGLICFVINNAYSKYSLELQ